MTRAAAALFLPSETDRTHVVCIVGENLRAGTAVKMEGQTRRAKYTWTGTIGKTNLSETRGILRGLTLVTTPIPDTAKNEVLPGDLVDLDITIIIGEETASDKLPAVIEMPSP